MKANARMVVFLSAVVAMAIFLIEVEWLSAQGYPAKSNSDQAQTAGQKFKNIQVLKDIPADQLVPSMQFITASLGVECDFCHVEHAMDKDDKKTKLAARKMMTMMMAINKTNFDGEREVTCYTCHRGAAHPVGTPILSTEATPAMPMHIHEEEGEAKPKPALPTVQNILEKYLAAVGGAESLLKIKTRVQKGNIEAFGDKYPIDIYSEAPEKRVSISHPASGASITAFNGEVGWLAMPRGVHQMTAAEQQAARVDAQLHFPSRLPTLYQDFQVSPGETIDGKATYLVSAKGRDLPSLRLYFDQQSGLLLRLIKYTETPLGRNPTEIDYADYRAADGVKIPYRWTLARPGGRFTIQVDELKQNVPIDQKLFVMPSGGEGH